MSLTATQAHFIPYSTGGSLSQVKKASSAQGRHCYRFLPGGGYTWSIPGLLQKVHSTHLELSTLNSALYYGAIYTDF